MIKLAEHKERTHHKKIEGLKAPATVYIPMSQHLGKPCAPEVKVGDAVLRGQRIGGLEPNQLASPIHASVSGTVTAIQDWPHPLLGQCKTIVIANDGKDTNSPAYTAKTPEEMERLSADQILKAVFDAGIVGMGGASFPTHIKLKPPKPVDSLIVNGAECEPYLTSDFRLMVEKTNEILRAIALIHRLLGTKKIYIAIEDNKPEAIKAFRAAVAAQENLRPAATVVSLRSRYPQGGEKQLTKSVLGREVPTGKLPFEVGVVVHNIATMYAIYEALYLGKPLIERVVTVTGDCLENPGNLRVALGTPIKEVIAACGPLKKTPEKIVFGGPMMGIAQYSLDVPVIKNTNGIILFSHAAVKPSEEAFCIRCSRCIEHCPLGLSPCLMSMASEREKWDLAKAYGCLECMECGACNFVCPQKRNIVQAIRHAKIRIPK